jgi:hypothetical protein
MPAKPAPTTIASSPAAALPLSGAADIDLSL